MLQLRIDPHSKPLRGEINIPGDKSISHRALILAALANGISHIKNFLPSLDCIATLEALRLCGVKFETAGDRISIFGVGLRGLVAPKQQLDCGNAGTAMRLLAGVFAGQNFTTCLTGDESLKRRPMHRIIEPLSQMGAEIIAAEDHAPLSIQGNSTLRGIQYRLPIASAQVKSAILLAGLFANGTTTLIEPQRSRDHTERLFQTCGIYLFRTQEQLKLTGPQQPKAFEMTIPGDISSAAFFMVAASLIPGSELIIKDVGINPTRTGILRCLIQMGADITISQKRLWGHEPVADITVRHAPLNGITILPADIPATIDELPILMIAAALARGKTVISGAAELRLKESDRIETMIKGLNQLGIAASARSDGAIIEGGRLRGGQIDTQNDHRIALGFSIAALCCEQRVIIAPAECIATSFPGFTTLANTIGIVIDEETHNV